MALLTLDKLTFAYDQQIVLDNVSFEVDKGDFVAIIGPNGGGKSTLLKNILSIYKPLDGTIKFLQKDIKENINRIGYVPQNTDINIHFPIKVIEVVLMGRNIEKTNMFQIGYSSNDKKCALNALKQVGMEKFADKKIGDLSGGQRQRVMIARALCSNPILLILDEPTANIDIQGQKQIYKLLSQLNKHITIIVVSHDISVILQYATKVIYVNKEAIYHDISQTNKISLDNEHFCEIEMLQMLHEANITNKV